MDDPTSNTICDTQLCRICINSHTNSMQMISIFGEDSLWQKITTLADVKIEKNDTLPQQVCVACAKNAISACLFKKKCEESDNFYRQQLLIKKIEGRQNINANGVIMITDVSTMKSNAEQTQSGKEQKQQQQQHQEHQQTPSRGSISDSKSGSSSNSSSNSSSSSSDDDDEEDEEDEIVNNALINISNDNNVHKSDSSQLQEQQSRIDFTNNTLAIHSVPDKHINASNHRAQLVDHSMATDIDDDGVDVDEGEVKEDTHGKEPFDLNSIRLMQQYMQHHMNKFNSNNSNVSNELSNDCGSDADEDEPLPLIPEIELITPSDEQLTMAANGTTTGSGHGMDQQREFQCPSCYQVFEMKQILKAHMQSVHGAPGPVYECTNCRKTYFYKRFLEKHIRRGRCVKKRRNQTRPMQCSDCHVLFPTGHHLGWHKRTGCPSRASNMPLQQLFKQNMTQFNNFPKRVGARKPDSGIYMNQRKVIMTNKRKGRARIKLDAKKISLAKQLILREATTTVIANELNISRTFAWRLRKSLVNGVSLHERVDDQNAANDEDQQPHDDRETVAAQFETQMGNIENQLQPTDKDVQCEDIETIIKEEPLNSEDDEHTLAIADDVVNDIGAEETAGYIDEVDDMDDMLHNDYNNGENLEALPGLHDNKIQQSPGGNQMSYDAAASPNSDDDKDVLNEEQQRDSSAYQQQQQQLLLESQTFPHIVNARQLLQQQSSAANNTVDRNGVDMSLLTPFPTGVSATLNQLPVNLSIRPIPHMTNNESNSSSSSATNSQKPAKKPRKPNVFIDDEKYAMAKLLVGENASTMEIARALNVSQMTAWKVRDAIIKGVPLSYRNKRDTHKNNNVITMVDNANRTLTTNAVDLLAVQKVQHRAVMNDQQLQLQRHLKRQQQIQQQQQHQQQLQQLQHQQIEMLKQQHQQQLQLQQEQQQKQPQNPQQIIQHQHQQQSPRLRQHTTPSIEKSHYHSHQQQRHQPQTQSELSRQQQQLSTNTNVGITKMLHPRRRLKAAEREQRDKQVTREILELIKEDSNIQYWKVSARLADKGIAISPSSVCQKLKSMGIHRRWKPGDRPPMVDIGHLKVASAVAAAAVTVSNGGVGINSTGLSADESYEQRFDLGGAHFLSAFTR